VVAVAVGKVEDVNLVDREGHQVPEPSVDNAHGSGAEKLSHSLLCVLPGQHEPTPENRGANGDGPSETGRREEHAAVQVTRERAPLSQVLQALVRILSLARRDGDQSIPGEPSRTTDSTVGRQRRT